MASSRPTTAAPPPADYAKENDVGTKQHVGVAPNGAAALQPLQNIYDRREQLLAR